MRGITGIFIVALLFFHGPTFGQKPKKKPNPEVKKKLQVLKTYINKRGKRDSDAIVLIEELQKLVEKSVASDKDAFAKVLEKALLSKRKNPNQIGLYTAAIEALSNLGTHGSSALLKGAKSKYFKKKDRISIRIEIVKALGKTKDLSVVKPLLDFLKDPRDEIIAAAITGLRHYDKAPEKTRKKIVEKIVRLFSDTTNGSLRSRDPTDMLAETYRRRLAMIAGPCKTTLSALTGVSYNTALEWLKWWNNNKNKKWDKKKKKKRKK